MGQRIVWTKAAVEDLQQIHDYIARDSEQNAAGVVAQILDAVEQSAEHPFIGRIVPEYDQDAIRERIVHSYRLPRRCRGLDRHRRHSRRPPAETGVVRSATIATVQTT
jgi:plasmid stabilization system protein ParE